ncbi:EAL and HDOD domain-containing protein [Paenibacillus chartarius]|uniref:EAL and HDOD domain-containing protein n=1 Tax=Paenibacillus chartarius TaxID=747481 RepID=A0ABV6DVT3_9BACL
MEVYAARQPIFDRSMNIYGYELLYRRSSNNYYEGINDKQATAELINNAYLVIQLNDLTGGTRAFINFSEELLVKEIPLLLPKEGIVVEVLERVKPTADVINACKKLKKFGYKLALDDFVFDGSYLPLIEIADIIKVEYPALDPNQQHQMIEQYQRQYSLKFLAEKIETREEHQTALALGYDFFQGYFFSKPVIVKGAIPVMN